MVKVGDVIVYPSGITWASKVLEAGDELIVDTIDNNQVVWFKNRFNKSFSICLSDRDFPKLMENKKEKNVSGKDAIAETKASEIKEGDLVKIVRKEEDGEDRGLWVSSMDKYIDTYGIVEHRCQGCVLIEDNDFYFPSYCLKKFPFKEGDSVHHFQKDQKGHIEEILDNGVVFKPNLGNLICLSFREAFEMLVDSPPTETTSDTADQPCLSLATDEKAEDSKIAKLQTEVQDLKELTKSLQSQVDSLTQKFPKPTVEDVNLDEDVLSISFSHGGTKNFYLRPQLFEVTSTVEEIKKPSFWSKMFG